MAVPFFPVTFWPMTVPPVPLVPPRNLNWKVAPAKASPVTLSYFSTIIALRGTFSNCTVLLSPPWRMTVCLVGSLELETGGGRHLLDGELAWVQALALLMETNLAIGVSGNLTEIVRLRRISGLASGGVRHMKTRPLDGSVSDAVHPL